MLLSWKVNISNSNWTFSNCVTTASSRNPTHPSFYMVYITLFFGALLGNLLLFCAYHFWAQRVLGKRGTSAYLLRALNALDFLTCVFLLANVATRFYESYLEDDERDPPWLGLFYSVRNVLLSYAMFTLALVAVDRMLAVQSPHSARWDVTAARNILTTFAVSVLVADMSVRLVIVYHPDCQVANYVEQVYNVIYGLMAFSLVFITYFSYILLFVTFYRSRRRAGRGSEEDLTRGMSNTLGETDLTLMSVPTPTGQPCSVNTVTTNFKKRSRSTTMSDMSRFLRRKLTGSGPEAESCDPVGQSTATSRSPRAHHRLGLILFCLSVTQTVSTLPLFLYNGHIIPFPGYVVYYFFYINCFMNPCIHFIARTELQIYLLCLCSQPHLAFTKRT